MDDRFQDPNVFKPASVKLSKWDGLTLEEWLFLEFEKGNAKASHVQALVPIFGAERLRSIYVKWKTSKKNEVCS